MSERTINLPDGLEPMSEEDLQTIWNKADDARGDQANLSDDVFDLVNALEAAYAQIDSLQQQLAERDRTIAVLELESKGHKALKGYAKILLSFIEPDGTPVDSYRFREIAKELRTTVTALDE
ncbi:hypothetical protein D3C74_94330 [compost metagenome]